MLKTPMALVIALVLGAGLLGAPPAQADPGSFVERMQVRLGLTDEQAQAIKEILARDTDTRRQLHQALRAARHDLRQLALDNGDAGAIAAKVAEIEGLLAQGLQLRVNVLQQIGPLLSQEQRDALAALPMGPWMMRHRGPKTPA